MASLNTFLRLDTLLTSAANIPRAGGKCTRVCVTWILALFCLGSGLPPAQAVTYYLPAPAHWSDNRQFVLRVDNRLKRLTLQQNKKPPFRTLWSIPYPQGWVPSNAYVTNDGRHVVLLDRYSSTKKDKTLYFLGPSGNALRNYNPIQFLTLSDVLYPRNSYHNIFGGEEGLFFLTLSQTCFAYITQGGTIRIFDVATGNCLDAPIEVKQQIRNEAILRARTWLFSPDNGHRTTGMIQVAGLGDRASLPTLTALLDFQTPTKDSKTRQDNASVEEGIRYIAAGALVTLLKEKSAPLLEARLNRIASDSIKDWIELYQKTGQARYSPKILQWTRSHTQEIRASAIEAMLKGGNPALVRQNPAWLTDKEENVRYLAIQDLSEHGDRGDLPLLRRALQDPDDYNRQLALHGLIRLRAPELSALLQRFAHAHKVMWVRQEAEWELARRGDHRQLQRLVHWTWSQRNHARNPESWPEGAEEESDPWEILALMHPPGLIPALQAASQNSNPDVRRPAIGVYAVVGDASALIHLRRLARVGNALQRAGSIHWLALCKDHASEPFLKAAQQDEDPIVQEAANKALKTLTQKDGPRP
ncbi:MAG: hypothetical protein JWN14_4182 [Chthonomonadales bacterium]|nr:hypothetical protein [Chthonomonadales bacterium]